LALAALELLPFLFGELILIDRYLMRQFVLEV
jgi:hypothetical protein